MKNQRINTTGTGLRGYVTASYVELAEIFGEPTYFDPRGDKVHCQWDLLIGRTVITLYDYKDSPTSEYTQFRWHIGGHKGGDAIERLAAIMPNFEVEAR